MDLETSRRRTANGDLDAFADVEGRDVIERPLRSRAPVRFQAPLRSRPLVQPSPVISQNLSPTYRPYSQNLSPRFFKIFLPPGARRQTWAVVTPYRGGGHGLSGAGCDRSARSVASVLRGGRSARHRPRHPRGPEDGRQVRRRGDERRSARGDPGPTEDQVAAVIAPGSAPRPPGGGARRLAVHRPDIEKWLAEGLRPTKIYRRLREQGLSGRPPEIRPAGGIARYGSTQQRGATGPLRPSPPRAHGLKTVIAPETACSERSRCRKQRTSAGPQGW
jgi:hypothetical protein